MLDTKCTLMAVCWYTLSVFNLLLFYVVSHPLVVPVGTWKACYTQLAHVW